MGDPLHCYDNAFVVLVLGIYAPSFDYNKDIKGKGVERWLEKAGKKHKEKSSWISCRRRFSRIGVQIQKVPVTRPSFILFFSSIGRK